MPIRITLRTTKEFSPFRVMLQRLIALPDTDSLILCSGYIWEPELGYYDYSILDDELLTALEIGCQRSEVVTIAGKLEGFWLDYYKRFVRRLRGAGLSIKPLVAQRKNWHAKVAIRLKGDTPVAAIIGSSNLTGPAYGIDRPRWNFESDVLIWCNSPRLNAYFREAYGAELAFGDMQLILDPDVRQLNEEQQLLGIHRDAMGSNLEELRID